MKRIVSLLLCLTLILPCCIVIAYGLERTPFSGIKTLERSISYSSENTTPTAEAVGSGIATTREEVLQPLSNDYRSRTETVYPDINGEDVTVYGFYRDVYESGNNPNFSQALMLYQCIKYKMKHPDKPVYISIQSFHFSIALAACVDPAKPDYGHTKNLYDSDYTDDGYIRLSYLLVEAAKLGIEVYVIGQLDAGATLQEGGVLLPDFSFVNYFNSHLNDDAYVSGKKVSDFMVFGNCRWTSYGDKSAADMMHNKTCTVSNYIDNNGVEHGAAIWLGSINIDGVDINEKNGNESIQTAVVITNHEKMRQIIYNFTRLVAAYCEQEDIVPFRVEAVRKTTEQIDLILNGKENEIEKEEQIVYLGTEEDSVFELYFTPLGGNFSTWDTTYNPFAKYIYKMLAAADSEHHIEFMWNNVKYTQNFELADIILEALGTAFAKNGNKDSILHLHLPGAYEAYFSNLTVGENVGYKFVNDAYIQYHIKDLQLSYVEDGVRQYITVLNSLNIHEGSSYHQTNTILIIKENDNTGNNFYVEFAALTSPNTNSLSRRVTGKK